MKGKKNKCSECLKVLISIPMIILSILFLYFFREGILKLLEGRLHFLRFSLIFQFGGLLIYFLTFIILCIFICFWKKIRMWFSNREFLLKSIILSHLIGLTIFGVSIIEPFIVGKICQKYSFLPWVGKYLFDSVCTSFPLSFPRVFIFGMLLISVTCFIFIEFCKENNIKDFIKKIVNIYFILGLFLTSFIIIIGFGLAYNSIYHGQVIEILIAVSLLIFSVWTALANINNILEPKKVEIIKAK